MSAPPLQVLIAGAGPTGLAAALFLARRGVHVRVVDAAAGPSTASKALAVNPRSLELLAETGVADRILTEGQRIGVVRFAYDGRIRATARPNWDRVAPGRPMTILRQARTEALLAEALAAHGVRSEYGSGLTDVTQTSDSVTATLSSGDMVRSALLLGAEGAHSETRKALHLGFPGEGSDRPWHLMDVEIGNAPQDETRIDFQRAGPVITLPFAGGVFRIIGFGEPLLPRLPADWRIGQVRWASEFRVSHRMVPTMAVGRVALAGDAAHIHSPIGGRGMNLGIEDAFVFAACAADALNGDLSRIGDYGRLRHAVDSAWVKTSRRLTGLVTDQSLSARIVKRIVPPLAAAAPGLIEQGLKRGLGLDHPTAVR